MKSFFANVWTKRVLAIVSVLYVIAVFRLCYFSLFYEIHIHRAVSQCLILSSVSLLALVVMLYTRKQIITRICSFLILPAMLPVVLLYFGKWSMMIPIIVTGVVILLLSGAGEGAKTALGTVILLMYIFGALGYFLFTSFFVTSADETVVSSGVSPSGKYRYRVVNTMDTSKGSTAVYIEPNDADKKFTFATFTLKHMEKVFDVKRPICEDVEIKWETQSRSEITEKLNKTSENIIVHLSDKDIEKIGYTRTSHYVLSDIPTEKKKYLGLKESDLSTVPFSDISEDVLKKFNIAKDESGSYCLIKATKEMCASLGVPEGSKVYLRDLNTSQLKSCHIAIDDNIYLRDLNDHQLELLGVPATGDVMLFNGEVCFRYYVAELENYFDVDSRKISIDILS